MNSIVLDASAVLAVAFNEVGGAIVMEHRERAVISAVNHAEVVSKLLRVQMPFVEIAQFLNECFPSVIPFDRAQSELAGMIHDKHRLAGLSYADCSCLSLAISRKLPVLTGDRKWAAIPMDMEVRLFR